MKIAQFYDFTDKNIYYGVLKGEKIYKNLREMFLVLL